MCLYNRREQVEKMLQEHVGKRYFYMYKSLEVNIFRNELLSPYREYSWLPGWNVSDSRRKKSGPCMQHNRPINRGIHVWRKVPTLWECQRVIVRVRCHLKDLIAADSRRAVFTKVYLERPVYQRAMEQKCGLIT